MRLFASCRNVHEEMGALLAMRFTRSSLPVWVAAGLLTATANADPGTRIVPAGYEFGNYDYYAQAEAPSPSDAIPPAVPNIANELPAEDAYQMRALPPAERVAEEENAPDRYLQTEWFEERGIATYGWLNAGIGANNWGAPWNGPITFNDRAWQGQMNQLYLVNERVLGEDLSWGGRVDLLYGTDYLFTTARGLDAYRSTPDPLGFSGPRWDSSRYYGLAMPQLYAEFGREDLGIKFGHFYTLIGYEVVPAIGNFFYTHAYTMQYGEPFTHTGILGTWVPNDQFNIIGGVTNGWDNWDDGMQTGGPITNTAYPGYNSNASLLAAATFSSSDESQALVFAITSGNEVASGVGPLVADNLYAGNLTMYSIVYTNEVSDKLTYVFQNDTGWWFNGNVDGYSTIGQQEGTAQWYGINQYLFWNFTDSLIGGLRFEWFRDNNGTRVTSRLRNDIFGQDFAASGFAGNFWEMTWGLNYLWGNNLIIRPELRYDWYSPDAGAFNGTLPYGRNFDQYGQFYGGCDAIWQF